MFSGTLRRGVRRCRVQTVFPDDFFDCGKMVGVDEAAERSGKYFAALFSCLV